MLPRPAACWGRARLLRAARLAGNRCAPAAVTLPRCTAPTRVYTFLRGAAAHASVTAASATRCPCGWPHATQRCPLKCGVPRTRGWPPRSGPELSPHYGVSCRSARPSGAPSQPSQHLPQGGDVSATLALASVVTTAPTGATHVPGTASPASARQPTARSPQRRPRCAPASPTWPPRACEPPSAFPVGPVAAPAPAPRSAS